MAAQGITGALRSKSNKIENKAVESKEIIKKNSDVFAVDSSEFGSTDDPYLHCIDTGRCFPSQGLTIPWTYLHRIEGILASKGGFKKTAFVTISGLYMIMSLLLCLLISAVLWKLSRDSYREIV